MLGGRPEVLENIITVPLSLFPIFNCQYLWSFLSCLAFIYFYNPFNVDIFSFGFLLFLISVLLYFLSYVSEMAEQLYNPPQIPSCQSAHKPWQGHTNKITKNKNKHINRRHWGFIIFCSLFYHERGSLHLLPLRITLIKIYHNLH